MTDTQADLVARLRKRAEWKAADLTAPGTVSGTATFSLGYVQPVESMLSQAADELERLRASNKQMREALLQIEIEATASEDAYALLKQIYALARAALKDAPNE